MVAFIITLTVTVAFGVARFFVPLRGLDKRDTFKDLAHLWVGGLFGAAIADGETWLWMAAIGLTTVELVAFFVRKGK